MDICNIKRGCTKGRRHIILYLDGKLVEISMWIGCKLRQVGSKRVFYITFEYSEYGEGDNIVLTAHPTSQGFTLKWEAERVFGIVKSFVHLFVTEPTKELDYFYKCFIYEGVLMDRSVHKLITFLQKNNVEYDLLPG